MPDLQEMADEIVDAAVYADQLREAVAKAKEARAGTHCEHDDDEHWPHPDSNPCWQKVRWIAADDCEPLPESEWCASCRKRQRHHESVREYGGKLAAARCRLTRLVQRYREAADA